MISIKMTDQSVEAVVSDPAPNHDPGVNEKPWVDKSMSSFAFILSNNLHSEGGGSRPSA